MVGLGVGVGVGVSRARAVAAVAARTARESFILTKKRLLLYSNSQWRGPNGGLELKGG